MKLAKNNNTNLVLDDLELGNAKIQNSKLL